MSEDRIKMRWPRGERWGEVAKHTIMEPLPLTELLDRNAKIRHPKIGVCEAYYLGACPCGRVEWVYEA